jgi:hypothetical protein
MHYSRRTDLPDSVHGRSVPSVQIGPVLESKAPLARELMLSQNVCRAFQSSSALLSLTLPPRCESCIDRLYTLGPAPCPICGKTLKKMTFIPQTFEDLVVEKEVAIRRKIAKESVEIFCRPIQHLTFVWDQVQQAQRRLSGSSLIQRLFARGGRYQ